MNENLEQGKELLRQKKYREAEAYFLRATQDAADKGTALEALVKTAQAKKDFDLKLKRINQLLAISPDDIDAEITKAHLLGRRGSLVDYRAAIAKIIVSLNERQLPSVQTGKKIMRGIQYACRGSQRLQHLRKLLESAKRASEISGKQAFAFSLFQAEIYFALGEFSQMTAIVEQFSDLKPGPPVLGNLRKVIEKYKNPDFPDYNAPKVFGIGLSRSATTSLNNALEILGFQSIHWLNPHTQSLIGEEDFLLFDGFTDIPVSYQFEKLYHTFPNAKFILTSRAMESWVRSVTLHYQNIRNISTPGELSLPDIAQRFNGEAGAVEYNLYAQHLSWEAAFQHFHERINLFFADKPKDRFLELRIIDGEGWEKLCTFLDRPVPDVPFPNTNQGPAHLKSKTNL